MTDFLHQYDGSPLARIVGTSRGSRALHPRSFRPTPLACSPSAWLAVKWKAAELQAQSGIP